jgi:thiamine biosynthesis lipoprotein
VVDEDSEEGRERAKRAFAAAEEALRAVEASMSTWIDDSEMSRLNRMPAGVEVELSPPCMIVLSAAQAAWEISDGAFDITIAPLVGLWRAAGETGRMPSLESIEGARARSCWEDLRLTDFGAVKSRHEVRVDLGGIAKGFGIDCAIDAMQVTGVRGGLVDVGGDLRVFGKSLDDSLWPIEIRAPFAGEETPRITVSDRAVCTSGDYARFVEIEGRRFSHIIDPRTGYPSTEVASATVIAFNALEGDIWATVLSVLGEKGLELLPDDVEAYLILGPSDAPREIKTEGFPE